MFRSCNQEVVCTVAGNGNTGRVQRLGVDMAIDGVKAEFAEFRRGDVARGQNRFSQILSGTGNVVVVGQYVGGGGDYCIDREGGSVAGNAAK